MFLIMPIALVFTKSHFKYSIKNILRPFDVEMLNKYEINNDILKEVEID